MTSCETTGRDKTVQLEPQTITETKFIKPDLSPTMFQCMALAVIPKREAGQSRSKEVVQSIALTDRKTAIDCKCQLWSVGLTLEILKEPMAGCPIKAEAKPVG